MPTVKEPCIHLKWSPTWEPSTHRTAAVKSLWPRLCDRPPRIPPAHTRSCYTGGWRLCLQRLTRFLSFSGVGRGESYILKKKICRPYSKTNLLILAPNSHSSLLDALEWKAMEEGHGSWRRKEKGRYPRKKRLKNSASPQPARGSSALCLQCLLPPHFPGQGTTGWFYLNCYQGKFLNYTGWWGWLKKCPVSQPWKKSQGSYCTLLPQQFRLLLGFKCLWRLFFFLLFLMCLCEDMCTWV